MRKGLRLLLAAGAVASALLVGCGGQAPEPKPLELVVRGVSDGGVEVCVDVKNASSDLDVTVTYSLSGPEGLRQAYVDYGVDESTLDGSLSGSVPVSGEWCTALQPAHSGVYTVTVRVPGAGLEESFSVEFDEPQFDVYGWTDGVTVPPGTPLKFNIVKEGSPGAFRAEIYVNDSSVPDSVRDPYVLDVITTLPSGFTIYGKLDSQVSSTYENAKNVAVARDRVSGEVLWRGTWFTTASNP